MSHQMNKGIIVAGAGVGINLALGVLYAWSIFKEAIKASIGSGAPGAFDWNPAAVNDPYAVACLVFAFTMILAGRMQDLAGPRITAATGGVLVSLGFALLSHSVDYWIWVIGFGGLVGAGIAFGYAAVTPAALKWFPPARSGLVTGVVVAGFGLASAYIAPLATYLVGHYGLLHTMLLFSAGVLAVVLPLSLLLTVPHPRHTPAEARAVAARHPQIPQHDEPHGPGCTMRLLKTRQFWLLWLQYFIGAGAGLMVIGSISGMAKLSMGESAFLAVAILALGNASGRILAGVLSDRFGRERVLAGVFLLQAALMFAAAFGIPSASPWFIVCLATLIGFNYGANLSLFPAMTKDAWGLRNFGANYGLLFTAWGMGGFVMSKLSEMLHAASGSYVASFTVAGWLLLAGFVLPFLFRGFGGLVAGKDKLADAARA